VEAAGGRISRRIGRRICRRIGRRQPNRNQRRRRRRIPRRECDDRTADTGRTTGYDRSSALQRTAPRSGPAPCKGPAPNRGPAPRSGLSPGAATTHQSDRRLPTVPRPEAVHRFRLGPRLQGTAIGRPCTRSKSTGFRIAATERVSAAQRWAAKWPDVASGTAGKRSPLGLPVRSGLFVR
jgi:hypothetical protein